MKMTIQITVDILDEVAREHDDGFGQPCRMVSDLMLRVLRNNEVMNNLFEVNDDTVVRTEIPDIQSVGIAYGKTTAKVRR